MYYIDERKDRQGRTYFSFTYKGEDGKKKRLHKEDHPLFSVRADAEAWAKSQSAIRSAQKDAHDRRLAWQTQHHKFEELVSLYEGYQKEHAPQSWATSVGYLTNWVFPYFLTEKRAGNTNNWHLFFREYRDWLKAAREPPLAISTQNNIVHSLNTFLQCLKVYNKIDPASAQKCEFYPEHMVTYKGAIAVISPDERARVAGVLRSLYPPGADFFTVLIHTGMRFSELFGLPITALFKGNVPEGPLRRHMEKGGSSCLGYIYLDSQPVHDDCRRKKDGTIERKPLKHRKTMGPKDARVIPITDRDVWNILAVRFKAQQAEFLKKTYGGEKVNYILFDDMEWNKAVENLRAAYVQLGVEPKGYHACRHTFTTYLVGESGNPLMVRMITGHKSQRAFERYLHIWEQIAQKALQETQEIDVI